MLTNLHANLNFSTYASVIPCIHVFTLTIFVTKVYSRRWASYLKNYIYQQLNHQYRDYRYRLHKDYYYKYNNNEMRLKKKSSNGCEWR